MMTFLQAAEAVATSEETRMGLWTLFTKGGWLMWPLLALGGVTIFIFVERFMAIRKASVLDMFSCLSCRILWLLLSPHGSYRLDPTPPV